MPRLHGWTCESRLFPDQAAAESAAAVPFPSRVTLAVVDCLDGTAGGRTDNGHHILSARSESRCAISTSWARRP